MEYEIMSKFPLLSASKDFTKWTGFISTRSHAMLLSLKVPQFPDAEGVYLETSGLNEKSVQYWFSVLKKVPTEECASFMDYLNLIERQVVMPVEDGYNPSVVPETSTCNPNLYSTVIDEIEVIGVEYIASLSRDFREMVIKCVDKSGREHTVKLSIPVRYPEANVKVSTELPFPVESIVWPARIPDIYQTFLSYVDKCCKFWDDMAELDSRVRVVDPLQPNNSHFHRRLLLEDNVIVHVIFNALAPRSLPQISFSGPEKHVEAFITAIDRQCNRWDDNLTVTQNLEMILDCTFIPKEFGDAEDDNEKTVCTVCYVYNFDNEIPEINCDCGAIYHRQCLYDLFVSDVSKTAFRRCVDCPSCQMEIRVPASFAASTW